MFRLIEIVKDTNDKESQSIYPFETKREAQAEFETKLGANMKADAYQAGFLVVMDDIGAIFENEKFGEEEISPRLVEFKTTNEEVQDNITKYDSVDLVKANFHSKLGAAMKDPENVRSIMLRGFDGKGESVIYRFEENPIPAPEPEPEEVTE